MKFTPSIWRSCARSKRINPTKPSVPPEPTSPAREKPSKHKSRRENLRHDGWWIENHMTNRISRRRFLKASAASAAILSTGAVWSQSTTQSSKLRWGVIGAGHRGNIHINAIKSFDKQMQILGVCDVMENHLAQGAKKAGESVQKYSDYQKLLANPDIDTVLIATPNMWHKEMVLAALDAKKNVMCEKPLAVNIDECKAIKSAVEATKQTALFTMQLRYSAHYAEVRKAIEGGRIGKPKILTMSEFRGDWNRGDVWKFKDPKVGEVNWRFSHLASGGTLNEKVCHYFDILHWMVGENPASISCTGGIAKYTGGRDTWDHATTTMRYPSG